MSFKKSSANQKHDQQKRRHWSQLFHTSSNSPRAAIAPEQLDRLSKERSNSHLYFLVGLVFSILVVQSAFSWKPSATPHTPLPRPDEVSIELVEMMDPVKVIEEEKSAAEPQPNTPPLIIDLSVITVSKKPLLDTKPEPPPSIDRAQAFRRDDEEVDDPFVTGNIITDRADVNPMFPGGQEAFDAFLKKHIRYSSAALSYGIEGAVEVSFVVDTAGNLSDFKVLKGMPYGMDKEVLRVMAQSPRWIPGSIKGHAVAVRYKKSVRFEIKN
ncbi:MAG: TonB family protein [Bacteroidetes bacterium]|nr:TonB family protein [Bacteroidota bacterium]